MFVLRQDLAYAQVAKYLKPKDSLDYLTHQMNVMESDTKALQVFLGKRHVVCAIVSSCGQSCMYFASKRRATDLHC